MIIYMYMVLSDLFALLSDAFCVDVIDECTYCDATENRYNVDTIPGVLDHILYKGYRTLVTLVASCSFLIFAFELRRDIEAEILLNVYSEKKHLKDI